MADKTKKTVSPDARENRRRKASFRLLPLVIFFSFLMLTFRVGVVWNGVFSGYRGQSVVAVTHADAQEEPTPSKVADAVQKNAAAGPASSRDVLETSFSQTEIDVLHQLAERREKLDVREKNIAQQAALLEAAQAQLDVKIAKLKELEKSIQELVGVFEEKEKKRMDNLVKIYSNMKPKEAARLFNEMNMDLLLRLFERMKEGKSAPILALMDSAKATRLTAEMANRKKLPGFDVPEE